MREGIDFFPLTVDVEERAYAAGKIPGSFFRREGRPTEQAILTCRLIDRPLRPSFPDGFRNETQVVITVIGADQENPHDVLAINAASAALMLSGIPFDGPIGAVRLAYSQDGTWIPHPTYEEGDDSTFELVVAGRQLDRRRRRHHDGRGRRHREGLALLRGRRPEGHRGGHRRGPRGRQDVDQGVDRAPARARRRRPACASRSRTRRCVDYGDDVCTPVEPRWRRPRWPRPSRSRTRPSATPPSTPPPQPPSAELAGTSDAPGEFAGREKEIKEAVRSLTKKLVRKRIVEGGRAHRRPRRADLRPLSAEVGVLPTAHGSGLFQRGETQVLNVTTLAMPRMNQLLDTIAPETNKRYMHHYNMAAVGQRRDRPRRLAQAPRDRPRRARRAGPAARRAQPGGVRLHAPPRVRGAVARTAPPRWRRCAPRRCR